MSKEKTTDIIVAQPRLPYPIGLETKFPGIDEASWKALCEAVFPLAEKSDSVVLALSYCKARGLDPMKRMVHIVPMWDSKRKCMVETVWPGIAELRATAHRTSEYAGRDAIVYGPAVTEKWNNQHEVTYPQWGQLTLYRMVAGQKCTFVGSRLYWKEIYSPTKNNDPTPNSRWRRAPYSQFEKCVEAAALRVAFPEEIGNEYAAEEVENKTVFDNQPPEKRQSVINERLEQKGTETPIAEKEPEKSESEPKTDDSPPPENQEAAAAQSTADPPLPEGTFQDRQQPEDSPRQIALKNKRDEVVGLAVQYQGQGRLAKYREILKSIAGVEDSIKLDDVKVAQQVIDELEKGLEK